MIEDPILEFALRSLAWGVCPNFAGYTKLEVENAFASIFERNDVKPKWFEDACAYVKEVSGGRMVLQEANPLRFTTFLSGPGEYLEILFDERVSKLFTMTPSVNPIVFEEENVEI